ncbi:hypothetical protein H181DRAFT_00916 [Streptomyces sp. WMMB 714]|jgi:hypothetical protein|nr:hypothetical protein H181DRAFT_00916 [Streptomyces sp. WMMB 714]
MIARRVREDEGQTVVLYGAVIAGLLFLAFAFFAVAQAGTVRNGGQTAADAAALAAAQDDRDELFDGFLDDLDNGDDWQDWLDGLGSLTGDGCGEAEYYADRNRADVLACDAVTEDGDDGYTVEIRTRFDTGHSIVPGASNKKAQASATAVIKPRCDFDDEAELIEITCDGEDFTIDPDDIDLDLKPSDLFSVVLVG